ncbi:hypothetical protein SK224_10820 [Microbacterium sp. BG28]|uniref:hypothetical protein n=1 Tax=Microbacterium sp. BG28 TaxID=3097356 RepID=UPI002A5AF632|nr:hypothetical protein [Microbacterium sp. BG28]MDY0829611.1 hypothetical protein [Microbacterium sp. BG28]
MTFSTILNILLLVVLVVWLGYRQSTWRPIRSGRMWRMPILLGIAGVAVLAQTVDHVTTLDIIALTVEAAISLGVGAAMGRIARIRPVVQPSARTEGASLESRTGWWGMALWLVVIASRIAIDVAAAANGAFVASSAGVILLLLAANRAMRVLVLESRTRRLVEGGSGTAAPTARSIMGS